MSNLTKSYYDTKNYTVVITGSNLKDENREKYGIRNKTTGVIEYYIDTFDNAMIAAETLSYILEHGTWRAQVEANINSIKLDDSSAHQVVTFNS